MNTISEIVTASCTTSKDADAVSKNLKKYLGCEANYEVARLALGRSLSLGDSPGQAPDSKGMTLKGIQLFGNESDGNYLWIALLSEQLRLNGQSCFSLEALQQLVRNHWHRGVFLLEEDWGEAKNDEAKFVELLSRRANLPETLKPHDLGSQPTGTDDSKTPASEQNCNNLVKRIKDIGITAIIQDSVIGPRLIRYRLFLSNAGDLSLLKRHLVKLEFSLGVGSIQLSQANEPQICLSLIHI